MSGGSMQYLYARFREEVEGRMEDVELEALMHDISDLLHDLEWYQSGDYGPETYRKTVKAFKAKWLGGAGRNARLERLIDERIAKAREECLQMIGVEV